MSGDGNRTCGCTGSEVCGDCSTVLNLAADDTAAPAPYGPYTHGERHRNPYYTALREVWRYKDGQPVELMIADDADVTDIIHAFGIGPDLDELLTKIFRLRRKPGVNIRQEFTKMHEHIQAAEDAWVADQEDK